MAKKNIIAAAATTSVLVAVGELNGGGITVASGAEVTDELQEQLGLDADAIDELIERGILAKVDVRAAEATDGAALATETKRADDAEAKVKELEGKLAEALKAAAPKPAQ